jgi:hypothetical protein
MSISGDYKFNLSLAGFAHPARLQIKPVRIAVDLDGRARLGDHVEYPFHITFKRRTSLQQSPKCVSPDLEYRLTHGGRDSFRHLRRVHLVTRVNAGNNHIKLLEHRIRIVERTAGNDV